MLEQLNARYGEPTWQRVYDPTSELVLTILSQNSADTNAEKAFEALRSAYASDPSSDAGHGAVDKANRPGWGGTGLVQAAAPDWMAVELAPLDELIDVIRPGGLAPQKAPRIQASLRRLREANGDHSLEFLGHMEPLAARDWLTSIDGVGVKTASVVLMMSFGMPLMPVDRHIDRVSRRIGLMPPRVSAEDAHDRYLALLEPAQCYPMHVGPHHARPPYLSCAPAHVRRLPHRAALPFRRPPRSVGPSSADDGGHHARPRGRPAPPGPAASCVGRRCWRTPRPSSSARGLVSR